MISHNPHSNCLNARLYYLDFLSDKSREGIPESTLYHIRQCLDCQAEIERLEMLLAHAEQSATSEQGRRDSAISTLLKLHFARAGEPVTCTTARPFLASLADPVLQVRVPTPITMHIDKCGQCSDDVQALRDLRLTHKQLCHLGQLLADQPGGSAVSCSTAQAAIPAVISMAFRETDAETLKHLCVCPSCRKHLYRRREAARQKLLRSEAAQGEFPCEAVSAADIYDYALPYGIDPADDQYAGFRPGLTSHLRACPNCLSKVQELHRTISAIAGRAESDVVTVYHLDASVGAPVLNGPVETGAGSVAEAAGRPMTGAGLIAERKPSVPLKVKPLLKAGLAAAAVVFIGLALLLNGPAAKAITIDQIRKAVEQARNVYIASFNQGQTEPVQERWVSRTFKVYVSKTRQESLLWDVPNRIETIKNLDTGAIAADSLLEKRVIQIEQEINGTLGLLPFGEISEIPRHAEWAQVTDNASQSENGDTELYDFTFIQSTYSGKIHKKWRFFVDPGTKRPQRVEFYRKQFADGEYTLVSVMEIEYLDDAEMEAVIAEASS